MKRIQKFGAVLLALALLAAFAGCGAKADTVSFTLMTYSGHDDHYHYVPLIEEGKVELKEGASVMDVISSALTEAGYGFSDEAYVFEVTAPDGAVYAAGDLGENSGWLFAVNDRIPELGMTDCLPEAGDSVLLRYVGDYNTEVDWAAGAFIEQSIDE